MSRLTEKLQAYVNDAEPWKGPHLEVMKNYGRADELSNFIYEGLDLYSRLKGRRATTFEGAVNIAQSYLQWLSVGHAVLPAIEHLESAGFNVEGSDEFRSAVEEVTIMAPRIIETRDGVQRAIDNEGVSLREFIDAI